MLTKNIPAEVNAAVVAVTVTDSTQTTATPVPDAPDTSSGTPSVATGAARKPDDFCTRYAHLIAEYGEPVSFNDNGSITLNEMLFAAGMSSGHG